MVESKRVTKTNQITTVKKKRVEGIMKMDGEGKQT